MHYRDVLKEYAHRLQNGQALLPEDAKEVDKFEGNSNNEADGAEEDTSNV